MRRGLDPCTSVHKAAQTPPSRSEPAEFSQIFRIYCRAGHGHDVAHSMTRYRSPPISISNSRRRTTKRLLSEAPARDGVRFEAVPRPHRATVRGRAKEVM